MDNSIANVIIRDSLQQHQPMLIVRCSCYQQWTTMTLTPQDISWHASPLVDSYSSICLSLCS